MSLANPSRVIAGTYRTLTDARAALVTALKGAGLNAAPVAPDSPTAGAAWPQWQQTAYNGTIGNIPRFDFAVFVVLNAGDFESTVTEADDVTARVAPALYPLAVVQMAEPVQITFGDGTTMPGIRFRVTTRT